MAPEACNGIGKPVQIEELRAALGTIGQGRIKHEADSGQTLMPNGSAREMFGDQYERFLDRFIQEGDALSEWLATADLSTDEVVQRCHKIASTAALFGAEDYRKALQNAEMAGKKNAEIPETMLSDINDTWVDTRQQLSHS